MKANGTIAFKASDELKAEVFKAAEKMGVTVSAYIRIAVKEKIRKEEE